MTRTLSALAVLAFPALAAANPRPLPFTYGARLMPPGGLEIEQYVDVVPVRVEREDPDGGEPDAVTAHRYQLQTELEYGVLDWLEASFYMVWEQDASAPLVFDGIKQRVRIRPWAPGVLPVDLAFYLEVAEAPDELELEQKIIVARSFGPVLCAVNLWVEQEFAFQSDETEFFYNPTAGASVQLDPHVQAGLEYWVRGRLGGDEEEEEEGEASEGPHHYLGPNLMLQAEPVWITAGLYLRLDELGEELPIQDPYGRFWVRVLFGVGLRDG